MNFFPPTVNASSQFFPKTVIGIFPCFLCIFSKSLRSRKIFISREFFHLFWLFIHPCIQRRRPERHKKAVPNQGRDSFSHLYRVLFVQLEDGQECLRGQLHAAERTHLFLACPAKPRFAGNPGGHNPRQAKPACGKVLPCGQNAWTR